MTMRPWVRGTLLLALTFAGGVAIGMSYQGRKAAAHDATNVQGHDALHRLATDLELDSAQQQAITEIFSRRQKDVDATWHAMQPHVRATLDSTHQEILGVLRPEQAAKFRKMMERMHPVGHR